MAIQLNGLIMLINNVQISYTADSLVIGEGFAEYAQRSVILGGAESELVFSPNLASKMGEVKVSIPTTVENQKFVRVWKTNLNQNVLEFIGPEGFDYNTVITQAALVNKIESNFATDGDIALEWMGNPAI